MEELFLSVIDMLYTEKDKLIRKYNVPGPRYTSYPTVPYWDSSSFNGSSWKAAVTESFKGSGETISLYIHLPYCESLCTFCGCNTRITVNHSVETSYIQAVLKEWELYVSLMKKKPVIGEIHLGGGTPTFFSPANLEILIKGITSRSKVSEEIEFGFEAHPNNTTKEHLQVLFDLGFRRLSLGIQDFSPRVQEVINRIQTFEKVQEVTECARDIGYTSINYDLVYGLPLQTIYTMVKTIEKVKMLKPDRIAFYSYAHIPWVKPGQRKFTEMDLPDNDVKRNIYESGRKMLERAGYHEIGMDHFALKDDSLYKAVMNNTLHRNFMGYTPGHTTRLIGLGVSAISDLWNCFGQNVKKVEEYKKLVSEGVIPVFRGHFLTEEDLVLRKHILNLMCRLYTSWSHKKEQTSALFEGLARMKEMADDGLVEIGSEYLKITEKGRPFLRNVCMALDARMWEKTDDQAQFSKVI